MRPTLAVAVGGVAVFVFCASCAGRAPPLCLGEPGGGDYVEGSIWVMFAPSVDETEATRIILEQGFTPTDMIDGVDDDQGVLAFVATPIGDECATAAAFETRVDVDAAGQRLLFHTFP